ncbi:MAG: retropepsin-like aspartic protease [Agriterribacter sp.]
MLLSCLKNFKKDRSDKAAVAVCDCYLDKIDKYFTNKQYKENIKNRIIDFPSLLNKDEIIKKQIDDCFKNSGKSILMSIESFQEENITECIASIQKGTNKTLNIQKVRDFCSCQFELIKAKKLSDIEYQAIYNPNSLLYYEVMYKCGSPFGDGDATTSQWTANAINDIEGPASDSIRILNFNGMTYARLKIGNDVLFWLFDTGANDLLITREMEEQLKKENILTQKNYLGTGEYEMANSSIDTCRKYIIQNVGIGKFQVNNVTIAVSDKAKKIILGRSLLNKFRQWVLDNKNSVLILTK